MTIINNEISIKELSKYSTIIPTRKINKQEYSQTLVILEYTEVFYKIEKNSNIRPLDSAMHQSYKRNAKAFEKSKLITTMSKIPKTFY